MEDTDEDAVVIDMTADTSVPTQTQIEQPGFDSSGSPSVRF